MAVAAKIGRSLDRSLNRSAKKIDRKLKRMATTGQRRIGSAMASKMATETAKALRKQVPKKQKSVRKTVGRKKVKGTEDTSHQYKVGFGVGKRTKPKKDRDPKRPGVGITKHNVHWFILGTKSRHTKSGRKTGRVKKAPPWTVRAEATMRRVGIHKVRKAGLKKLLQEVRK